MPQWSSEPPSLPLVRPLPLMRTPVGKGIGGTITCDGILGCPTHYWGGRTVPCEAEECAACNAGQRAVWHGYVSAYDEGTRCHFIFEFTDLPADEFNAARRQFGTLRGVRFSARRAKPHKNARVLVTITPPRVGPLHIPKEPDLAVVLCHIWRIPTGAVVVDDRGHTEATLHLDPGVMGEQNGNGRRAELVRTFEAAAAKENGELKETEEPQHAA